MTLAIALAMASTILAIAGCGNNSQPPQQSTSQTTLSGIEGAFEFVIVLWRWDGAEWAKEILTDEISKVPVGIQFELQIQKVDDPTSLGKIPMQDAEKTVFYKDDVVFQPIDVGLTPDGAGFYRVDERNDLIRYRVEGVIKTEGRSFLAKRKFQVVEPPPSL